MIGPGRAAHAGLHTTKCLCGIRRAASLPRATGPAGGSLCPALGGSTSCDLNETVGWCLCAILWTLIYPGQPSMAFHHTASQQTTYLKARLRGLNRTSPLAASERYSICARR